MTQIKRVMQIKDVDKLKVWLFSKLEPLCDADPTALSKYVVALLRKEKPKAALKELCIDQLEVFLAKETGAFVEKLFRCLESESYLKREETPPPSPPPPKSKPAEQPQSSGKSVDKRQTEDIRRKEVDDDDRDFRRSKRHESEGSGDQPKRPTAPISVGRGEGSFAGKKRRNEDGGTSSGIKRRNIEGRSKPPESSSAPTSGSVDMSSTSVSTAVASEPPVSVSAAGRRPVRERLGPRPADDRSDGGWSGGRKHHRGHSPAHSRSSSSSDNDSGSDSDSSTGSSVSGGKHSRKRKRRHIRSKEPKKRQRCKDYDGESCPYDHGVDPLVIGGGLNPYPLGLPPPVPPGLPLPPLGKPPNLMVQSLLPPPPPVLPPRASPPPPTTSTDGYNPEDPGLSSSSSSRGFIPTPILPPHPMPLQQSFPPPPSIGGISIPPPPSLMSFPPPRHLTASTTLTASTNFHHQMRPRPPFGGRGQGKPSDTLIIRKIPRELNTITKLSSHFEKFGTVVNLTVRYEGDPEGALVQFSNPTEAKKAHSSTEAVLNNRFIRIYFLRKDHIAAPIPLTEVTLESPASVAISTIHGAPPTAPPPASKEGADQLVRQVTANNTSRGGSENHVNEDSKSPSELPPHPSAVKASPSPTSLSAPSQSLAPPPSQSVATPPPQSHAPPPHVSAQQRRKSAEAAKKKLELQKKTSELLQKQIQQQKLLISKLEKSGKHLSSEEKEAIMKSLKTLSGSISKLKEAATKTVANKGKPESVAQKPAPMHQQQQQKQQTTDELKAKADALRKQAHMLGLLSSPSQPLPTTDKGHNQRHDLRAKLSRQRQLLVINVANRDQLTTYFDSFGGLEGVEVDPGNPNNLIFTFRNQTIANQVVNKGSTLNGKPLIMKWYTPKQPGVVHPTLPTVKASKITSLPHHQTADVSKPTSLDITTRRVVIEKQPSIDDQLLGPTTPTLTKLDPDELHLVEDSDDEEEEGRSWRR